MSFIFERSIYKIILSIDSNINYIYAISKQINMTYSTTHKSIVKLISYGLVEEKKDGRRKIITLTNKGQKIKDCLCLIETYLNEKVEEVKEE